MMGTADDVSTGISSRGQFAPATNLFKALAERPLKQKCFGQHIGSKRAGAAGQPSGAPLRGPATAIMNRAFWRREPGKQPCPYPYIPAIDRQLGRGTCGATPRFTPALTGADAGPQLDQLTL